MNSALTVSGLTKRYEGFTLADISFEVPQGTITGLIGENGAGKSTTLHSILGLVHRDGGEISILRAPAGGQGEYRRSFRRNEFFRGAYAQKAQ